MRLQSPPAAPPSSQSLVLVGLVSLALFASCGTGSSETAPEDELIGNEGSALDSPGEINFRAHDVVSSGLVAGRDIILRYDAARLADCRGTINGKPAWSITAFASINGAEPTSFAVGGYDPNGGGYARTSQLLPVDGAGELQLWFQITNVWGCSAWDSDYGRNHRFQIGEDPRAPDWMGNVKVNISRSGMGCDSAVSLEADGFSYGTWARSRAAEAILCFQAYEPGVTDWNNPDLWQQLDARLYYRSGSSGDFRWKHVSLESRTGNDARYRVELRELDPFRLYQDGCPDAVLRRSQDGQYMQSRLEFFFQVNGRELRPAAGGAFVGAFEDYASAWAHCE